MLPTKEVTVMKKNSTLKKIVPAAMIAYLAFCTAACFVSIPGLSA